MQNRRMFLGSAAAAGVGAAVGGVMLMPPRHIHAQTAGAPDPVLAELQKQLTETVVAVRKRQGRAGEHARRVAATIRLLNAHGVGLAADAALRRRVEEEGREGLLARELDMERLAAELQAIGVDRVPTLMATYADRARMLDQIIRNGTTAALAALSASFDRMSVALDRNGVTTVAARQMEEECFQWLIVLTSIEALMWQWCTVEFALCVLLIQTYVVYANFACSLGCFCAI